MPLGNPCGDRELAAKPAASRVIPSCRSGTKLWMNYLLVFIGGGLGSALRHLVNVVTPRLLGTAFPYHTFIINISGSIIMGLIAGYLGF